MKGLRGVAGAGLVAAVAAFPSLAAASSLAGPYVALGAGIFSSQIYEISDSSNHNGISWKETGNAGQEDWVSKFDFIFGFGEVVGDFYLATEFNYTVGNLDGEIYRERAEGVNGETYSSSLSADAGDGFGASVRLGRMLSESNVAYARVTYQQREIEFTASERDNDSRWTESVDEDFSGFGFGFGFEHVPVDSPLGFRGEAMRIEFDDETLNGIKVEPVEHSFNLYASYHF